MTRVIAFVGALTATPAFAHPHHDATLNLSHSHVGEVAVVVVAVVGAAIAYRVAVARRR